MAHDVDLKNPATCVGCSCTDNRACLDGCYWLELDRDRRIGLCSSCRNLRQMWVDAVLAPDGAVSTGSVDCGECPRVMTGCRAGHCLKARHAHSA